MIQRNFFKTAMVAGLIWNLFTCMSFIVALILGHYFLNLNLIFIIILSIIIIIGFFHLLQQDREALINWYEKTSGREEMVGWIYETNDFVAKSINKNRHYLTQEMFEKAFKNRLKRNVRQLEY